MMKSQSLSRYASLLAAVGSVACSPVGSGSPASPSLLIYWIGGVVVGIAITRWL